MRPKHVAIVLDGNRRFAKRKGLNPLEGHKFGAEKLLDILKWLKQEGVEQATLYTLSTENLKRTPIEVEFLMMLFRDSLKKAIADNRLMQYKVRVRFIGRLGLLPRDIQELMKQLTDKTAENKEFTVTFCVAYGGKAELVDAINKIIKDVKDGKIDSIDEQSFPKYLYMADDVDLFIRPGEEKRLSNFLPWQLSYTELIFLDKLLPELEKEDIIACLDEFEKRERRMGK